MSPLADVLEAHQQQLLERWLRRVHQHVASGENTRAELKDHLPSYLQDLVGELRKPPSPPEPSCRSQPSSAAQQHGRQRFHLGFDAEALVREYAVLQGCILELIEEHGGTITLTELRTLTDFISTAIADGIAEHTRQSEARRQAEAATAELEAIFQSLPDAVYLGNAHGITRANPQALSMLGYSTLEELNRNIATLAAEIQTRRLDTGELIPGEDQPFTHALQGRPDVQEVSVRHLQTGEERVLRSSCAPIRVRGEVVGAVAINTDITERTRAEREAAQLATVVEQSTEFIAIAHLDGQLFFVNRAGQRLVGLDSSERVRHTRMADLFTPESLAEADRISKAALEIGQGSGEVSLRHFETGEALPVWWHVFPIKHPQTGQPVALATVSRDLREQKRHEAEVQRRLGFEQQLIGIVSHDLRNPLNAILLGAQALLRREDLNERATKAAARIQSSAERAIRMVRDLLDFTQARLGGGLPVRPQPVNLHEFTRKVVEEVQMSYPEREFRLSHQGDGRGFWDSDRLAQLLTNLVTNAAKYSPQGTPVTIRTRGEEREVCLEVHNLGPPIQPEMLRRLFEPLQRAAAEVERNDRSVGLGLYIVDHIVRAHGGTIDVRSTAEQGTTFTVRLPRTREGGF